jgi:hypothetical protein
VKFHHCPDQAERQGFAKVLDLISDTDWLNDVL